MKKINQIENEDKLLDNDKYDELLAYANKKASKKSIILSSNFEDEILFRWGECNDPYFWVV